MSRYPEFDAHSIESHPFASRESKVNIGMAARPARSGASFAEFLDSLPCLLGADALRLVAGRIAQARRRERAVVVSCGGHVVKCGLAPTLIGLMERGPDHGPRHQRRGRHSRRRTGPFRPDVGERGQGLADRHVRHGGRNRAFLQSGAALRPSGTTGRGRGVGTRPVACRKRPMPTSA